MRLSVEDEGFHQTLESVRVRNDVYVKEVQPVIEREGFNKKSVTIAECESAMGERVFGSAMNTSRYMYENVAAAHANLRCVHEALFALAKKLYPRDVFY